MANKNTDLGGTDWVDGDDMLAADLNDTFNAAFSKIQSLSLFWLNTELYTTFDDFESYSLGAFTTTSDWDVSAGDALVTCTIESGDLTGEGGSKYLKLNGGSVVSSSTAYTGYIASLTLVKNKHSIFKITTSGTIENGTCTVSCTFGTQSAFNVTTLSGGAGTGNIKMTAETIITVIAKGSDSYDVYLGGTKKLSSVTDTNGQIKFTVAGNTGSRGSAMAINFDEVRQSTNTIS